MLEVFAPAKVNLFLGIGHVRPDGYHSVTTVLHALELGDTLRIEAASSLSLHCSQDLGIPVHRNLVYRAATSMAEAFGRDAAVSITLDKQVPSGAGLGGGSSDAAAMIAGLAHLWGVDARSAECLDVARSLGADVPFFLTRTGAALMTGRGDELEVEIEPFGGVSIVLLRPNEAVPTPAAYAAFDASPRPQGDPDAVLSALERRAPAALAEALSNNMEAAAISVVPAVADALALAKRLPGVLGCAVAGSGSAVFGVCEDDESAEQAARAACGHEFWGKATRLRGCGTVLQVTGGAA